VFSGSIDKKKMSNIRQISEIGSAVLRQRAAEIAWIADPEIDRSIDDLIATVVAANGVGIAAPQVGLSVRLFIVASRPSPRYPHAPTMEPTPTIDPQILDRSTELVSDWEGCLSVPGTRGLVPRHETVEVAYFNKYGERIQQELTGFVARIFQHELDHLDGILFPDRVLAATDLITEAEYMTMVFDRSA
jgi:peptide deformylase